jgi:hypothetical protein
MRVDKATDNSIPSSSSYILKKSYLKNSVSEFKFVLKDVCLNVRKFVETMDQSYFNEFYKSDYKVQLVINVTFKKEVEDKTVTKDWIVSTKGIVANDINIYLCADDLDKKVENYSQLGSSWTIQKINYISFLFVKFNNFSRLTGNSFIPTPTKLSKKKCLVNVQNNDNCCFLYSILAILLYENFLDNRHRQTQYMSYLSMLNYKHEEMPMKVHNISRFERKNNLKINVIKYLGFSSINDSDDEVIDNPHFRIIYKSLQDSGSCVNLLLIEDDSKFHYVAITNLNKLINSHGVSRTQNFWCECCLRGFRLQKTFEKHLSLCNNMTYNKTIYTMPEKTTLTFEDFSKTISPKYIIYADFESLLEKPDIENSKGIIQVHKPSAAALLVISPDGALTYKYFYGNDCILEFLLFIKDISKSAKQWYNKNANKSMLPLTSTECKTFENSTICYLCRKLIECKVADHCHFTGLFLGAACSKCNLSRRIRYPFLPIVFHNLRGYDVHHILKYAMSNFNCGDINCIPQSSEKLLSLSVYIQDGLILRFIDSLMFLNGSLDNLSNLLVKKPLTNTLSLPSYLNNCKGIFPYSFTNSFDKLETTLSLPTIDVFEKATPEQYKNAQKVWQDMNCKNLKDYLLLYLKIDVYLLADVFETFRVTAITEDELDPANFYTIPGLSFQSALKNMAQNGYTLDLLRDSSMYEFFESGVRGGMTFVNKHHVVCDANTELLYIDANNLYGWALSQKLPMAEFEWIYENLNSIVCNLPDGNSDIGYVLEVDMCIPNHLHNKFCDLPPAPRQELPPKSSVKKLLLTLHPKTNYVIHYLLLKYYIELGVIVTHVHRAVRFKQDFVFKDYIELNTKKRAEATNSFAKDYYKLKNNSLFGKTVENIRKRTQLRLCNTPEKLICYSSKWNFQNVLPIDQNLVAVSLTPEKLTLDRPVYVGQAILDLSKLLMYKFNYSYLEKYRKKFSCELNIVAGDTDSFFLECKNISLKDKLLPAMIEDELLDTSNYQPENPLYHRNFPNAVGKFKDETAGKYAFTEWVFLRPKCYSLLGDKNIKKAKGIAHSTVDNCINHEHYKKVYESLNVTNDGEDGCDTCSSMSVNTQRIGSKRHQLYTFDTPKTALCCLDNKRKWLSKNASVPYGHYMYWHELLNHNNIHILLLHISFSYCITTFICI